jgi:hypothetical protein
MAGGLVLIGGAAVSTACVKDDSTVFIFDVLEQQLVSSGSQCLYTSDPTQAYISGGYLDVGFRTSYSAEFLVGNQIVPQGNPSIPQTETSYVQFEGAVVAVNDTDGNQISNYTYMVGAAALAPAQGTTPSYEPIGVTIVDQGSEATVDSALKAGGTRTFITQTYFFGHTLGGESVQTNTFTFPVVLCYGCLVGYSQADIDENASITPNCLLAANSTSASTTLPEPCILGQDDTVDCSQCLGYLVCRGNLSGITSSGDAGTD